MPNYDMPNTYCPRIFGILWFLQKKIIFKIFIFTLFTIIILYLHLFTLVDINVATDEGNSQNEILHWKKDEIRLAVQNCLWVWVELAAYNSVVRASERNSVVVGSNLVSEAHKGS